VVAAGSDVPPPLRTLIDRALGMIYLTQGSATLVPAWGPRVSRRNWACAPITEASARGRYLTRSPLLTDKGFSLEALWRSLPRSSSGS